MVQTLLSHIDISLCTYYASVFIKAQHCLMMTFDDEILTSCLLLQITPDL